MTVTTEVDWSSGAGKAPAVELPLNQLRPGAYIRVAGINEDHVRALADWDGELPPIVVQRSTMRVIDGVHRVKAAKLRGDTSIHARLVDLSDHAAFVQSVAANIGHGLPLSLSDRKAAAARMMTLFPQWSDRALGRACGLSGKTISAFRVQFDAGEPERRIGLDGKSRPVDSGPGRRVARELLDAHPDAPLREIAREAGVSPGTVRKVRDSMRAEVSGGVLAPVVTEVQAFAHTAPEPEKTRSLAVRAAVAARAEREDPEPEHILQNLRQDPSLIYRTQGRDLLRLLQRGPVLAMGERVIDSIPSHCLPAVAALTRYYAQEWAMLTGMLENRARREIA
ncbi:ParB/RepB/Spo0J family partition protein, partial [Actinoplanes sp. NPDC051470]|uniref:ParB/RepB/Spo0J family partition protein n=1 Tax=Actinoplanes sp. NPDC051470 TaxID=3157224 RepID=UPI0034173870